MIHPTTCLARAFNAGLLFWLLLSPGDNWTWVIVGGHDSRSMCEEERAARLDGDYLVCVRTGGAELRIELTTHGVTEEGKR